MRFSRTALAFAMLAVVAACGSDTTEPPPENEPHVFTYRKPEGAPAVTSVHVAGSFNAWSPTARAMTQQTDGTWRTSVTLAEGTHQYKYVINGDTWVQNMCNDATWGDPAAGGKVDPNVTSCIDDGFGGQNAVLVVQ